MLPVGIKKWGFGGLFIVIYHTTYLIFMTIGPVLFEKMDSKVWPILYHCWSILEKSLTSEASKGN